MVFNSMKNAAFFVFHFGVILEASVLFWYG